MVNDRQMTWDELAEENSNLKAEKAVVLEKLAHETRRADSLHGRRIGELESEVSSLTEKNKGLCEALKRMACKNPCFQKDGSACCISAIALQQFGGGR